MAKQQVVMPQMGESITTGTITKWNKQVGEVIELDEILLEISTDKVESEIPSPISGKIVELLYPVGTTVDVGKVIAYIDSDVNSAVSASVSPSSSTTTAASSNNNVENKVVEVKSTATAEEHHERRFYTPLVRKMAEEAGLPIGDLSKISGSGAGGRVNKSDLENYLSKKPQSNISAPTIAASKPTTSPVTSSAKFEVIPMDNMRKAIAKNMVESKLTSPHVNSIGEVDMSHLVKFRESFKNTFEKQEGFKLTYTPFIMRAIVMALKQFPLVKACLVLI
jgi:2-oxoglutarate dehydrogenase E2 component (dihydrolipoamide succinyltransferase)